MEKSVGLLVDSGVPTPLAIIKTPATVTTTLATVLAATPATTIGTTQGATIATTTILQQYQQQ